MGLHSTRELLLAEYGSELQSRVIETDVTVGTSIATLVAGNGARIWITFENTGANTVFVSTNSALTANQGFILSSGGYLNFTWKDDNELPTVTFYAISAGSGNGIHIVQEVLTGSGE